MNNVYQFYDFTQDLNVHIDKKIPIELKSKSLLFAEYLFKLKIFQLDTRIAKSHELFEEEYFIFIKSNIVFVAKKIGEENSIISKLSMD